MEQKRDRPSLHGTFSGGRARELCGDLLVFAGGAAITVGAFLLHVAAGCFVLGGVLLGLAFLLQRGAGDKAGDDEN